MGLEFQTRLSPSPWVHSVWTSRSSQVTEMTAVANETWGLVFWKQDGRSFAGVTGPESRTCTAPVPEDASFAGIQFALGTSLRMVANLSLIDSGIELPDATSRRFVLGSDRWETPHADDAEALVERLVGAGVVVRDPVVTAALHGRRVATDRTLERRFRAATGFSRGAIMQIARARAAARRLSAGVEVGEVVHQLGFYDEPHLARALRRYIGRTAGQLRRSTGGALALAGSAYDVVDGFQDSVGVGGGLTQP